MIIVYMTGVFDILHKGHLRALRRAQALGDFLVVGVQSDVGVLVSKGKVPCLSTHERVDQMKELSFIDRVIVYDQTTVEIIKNVNPNIFACSPTWVTDQDRTAILKELKSSNIQMVTIPYTEGISSTEIKKRIYDTYRL